MRQHQVLPNKRQFSGVHTASGTTTSTEANAPITSGSFRGGNNFRGRGSFFRGRGSGRGLFRGYNHNLTLNQRDLATLFWGKNHGPVFGTEQDKRFSDRPFQPLAVGISSPGKVAPPIF